MKKLFFHSQDMTDNIIPRLKITENFFPETTTSFKVNCKSQVENVDEVEFFP